MPKVIDNTLSQLAGLLGPLSPFTKAVVPAALGVAELAVNLIFTGSVNSMDLTLAGSNLLLAVVVYLLPNRSKQAVQLAAAKAAAAGTKKP